MPGVAWLEDIDPPSETFQAGHSKRGRGKSLLQPRGRACCAWVLLSARPGSSSFHFSRDHALGFLVGIIKDEEFDTSLFIRTKHLSSMCPNGDVQCWLDFGVLQSSHKTLSNVSHSAL